MELLQRHAHGAQLAVNPLQAVLQGFLGGKTGEASLESTPGSLAPVTTRWAFLLAKEQYTHKTDYFVNIFVTSFKLHNVSQLFNHPSHFCPVSPQYGHDVGVPATVTQGREGALTN